VEAHALPRPTLAGARPSSSCSSRRPRAERERPAAALRRRREEQARAARACGRVCARERARGAGRGRARGSGSGTRWRGPADEVGAAVRGDEDEGRRLARRRGRRSRRDAAVRAEGGVGRLLSKGRRDGRVGRRGGRRRGERDEGDDRDCFKGRESARKGRRGREGDEPSSRSRPTSHSHSLSGTASLAPSCAPRPCGRPSHPLARRCRLGAAGALPNVGRREVEDEADESGMTGEGKGTMRRMGGSWTATRRSDGVTQTLREGESAREVSLPCFAASRGRERGRTSRRPRRWPSLALHRRESRSPAAPAPRPHPSATPPAPCRRRAGRRRRWSSGVGRSSRLWTPARSSRRGGGRSRS